LKDANQEAEEDIEYLKDRQKEDEHKLEEREGKALKAGVHSSSPPFATAL